MVIEPVLVPEDDRNSRQALRADWSARGVWEGSRVALFDKYTILPEGPGSIAKSTAAERSESGRGCTRDCPGPEG